MAGPAGGVNAVEMTLAIQPEPAAASRASSTCTTPSGPLIVEPPTVLGCVPRLPEAGGTVITSAPPTMGIVAAAGPAADAGRQRPPMTEPATKRTRRGKRRKTACDLTRSASE